MKSVTRFFAVSIGGILITVGCNSSKVTENQSNMAATSHWAPVLAAAASLNCSSSNLDSYSMMANVPIYVGFAESVVEDSKGNLYATGFSQTMDYWGASSSFRDEHWIVRKSLDGGVTWSTVDELDSTVEPVLYSSGSPSTILVGLNDEIWVIGQIGFQPSTPRIRKSEDGGTTWQEIPPYQIFSGTYDSTLLIGCKIDTSGNLTCQASTGIVDPLGTQIAGAQGLNRQVLYSLANKNWQVEGTNQLIPLQKVWPQYTQLQTTADGRQFRIYTDATIDHSLILGASGTQTVQESDDQGLTWRDLFSQTYGTNTFTVYLSLFISGNDVILVEQDTNYGGVQFENLHFNKLMESGTFAPVLQESLNLQNASSVDDGFIPFSLQQIGGNLVLFGVPIAPSQAVLKAITSSDGGSTWQNVEIAGSGTNYVVPSTASTGVRVLAMQEGRFLFYGGRDPTGGNPFWVVDSLSCHF